MGSQFYLQSTSTSATSLPLSQTPSNQPNPPSRAFASPSPPPSRQRRPNPTSLNITFGDSFSSSDDSDDETSSLPFPAPLPRSDFLISGDFDPSAYLSSVVSNRYQTLEDLREELRGRVASLNDELVELVNRHQEEFVGLGSSLRGGEERVEEVRVGVLGLRREVEEVRRGVEEKEKDVESALKERRELRWGIEKARALLEYERGLGELEGRLNLGEDGKEEGQNGGDELGMGDDSEDSEDEEDEEEGEDATIEGVSLSRLKRRIEDLQKIQRLGRRAGADHPFIKAQQQRVTKCRSTLLLDLNACLKQMKDGQGWETDQKMGLLALYKEIDASKEAVHILTRS